ncbi:EF-hand domain-containing protein [Methylocystis sp. SC2]|uniref:EF-hand domain-containing protein n=1 Tax=Methylocystis sp. (strain SC2) TaxID=187303 RepID=UPI00027AE89D|nr:EF-hand domain-containing protein [Methylocystis sp. SC2]CCJ07947.1 Hemolysin-type calcium-binding region [Methylocystis sp. SC2]
MTALNRTDIVMLDAYARAGDRHGYYSYLASFGDGYAGLARDVVTGHTLSGYVANNYMETAFRERGISVTPDLMNRVGIELMREDLKVRQDEVKIGKSGLNLDSNIIAEYHRSVFEKFSGGKVGLEAWTAGQPLKDALAAGAATGDYTKANQEFRYIQEHPWCYGIEQVGKHSFQDGIGTQWGTWVQRNTIGFIQYLARGGEILDTAVEAGAIPFQPPFYPFQGTLIDTSARTGQNYSFADVPINGSVQFLEDGKAGSNGASKSQLDVTRPGNSSFGNDYGDGNLPGNGTGFSVSAGNSVTTGFGSGLFGDATSGLSGLFGDATSALGNLLGSGNYSLGFVDNGFVFNANFGYQGQNINLPDFGKPVLPFDGGGSESGIGFNSLGDLGRMFGGLWSDVKSVFSSVGNFFDNIFGGIGDFFSSIFPVALDLNGDGVQLTPVTSSNTYFDMAGDGYQHLTAWAAPGDALLAYDANNDGKIDQQNEIDFTQWDPTATSDMQALRDVFDTNHDGKLSASDAKFSQFKLIVSNADGSTVATPIDGTAGRLNQCNSQTRVKKSRFTYLNAA